MKYLRQSTQVTRFLGPFLDKADGVTEETGLAGAATEISKDGAAYAAGPVLGTHDSDGWYPIVLTTTHTNTVGELAIKVHDATTHLPVWEKYLVIEEAIYDALFAASANAFTGAAGSTTLTALATGSITAAVIATGAIDADAIADNAIDAGAIAADAITAAKIATGAIDADALAADAGTEIATAVWASATRTLTAGTNIDGSTFTAIPWNAAWDAEVQSEVDDALIAKGLDHLVFTSVTGTDVADDSIIARLVSKSATADWDSYNNTTDSHEALRDRGDAAWTTATGFSTHSAADVWASGTRTLTALGFTLAAADLAAGTITAAKFAAGAIDATAIATGAIDADALAADAVAEIWGTALTESYGTDGSALTGAQLLYLTYGGVLEHAISGTTKTVKKLDGSTTGATFTLDSSTTPSSITRSG